MMARKKKKKVPITIRAALLTVVGGGIFVLIGSILTPYIQSLLDKEPITATSIASLVSTQVKAIETETVAPSNDLLLPTAKWTPVPSDIPLAAVTIFEDTFIDNRNNWDIASGFHYVAAGKYTYKVECPANYSDYFCGTYVRVPFVFPRNFRMEIDLTVLELSPDAKIAFGFQMRRNDNNLYYITYFITDMFYSLWGVYNTNGFEIIPKTSTNLIAKELGSTNRFGVELQDSTFTPIINEYRLPQGEDGNIPNAGDTYLVIFVSRGHSAMITLDNLIVQEVK